MNLGSAYPGGMQGRHLPDEVQGFGRGLEGQAAKTGLEQGHSHAPCIRLHTAMRSQQCHLLLQSTSSTAVCWPPRNGTASPNA